MEIRTFDANDILKNKETLTEMLRDNYRVNFPDKDISPDFCREKFEMLVSNTKEGNAFVWAALLEEGMAGFAWAFLHEYFGEKRLHINHIFVKKEHRHQGIARSLMEAILEWTRSMGTGCVDLYVRKDNAAAAALYSRLGFETERVYMTLKVE